MPDTEPILTKSLPTLVPWPTRLSSSLRSKFFLTGVIYPVCCLIFVGTGARPQIGDLWQDGNAATYITILLSSPTFFIFLPLIIFSMIGLGIWCIQPKSYSYLFVRLGIFAGLFLTLQFNVLLWFPTLFISPIMGSVFMVGQAFVVWLIGLLLRRTYRFTILHLLILTTAASILLGIIIQSDGATRDILLWPASSLFFMLAGAPFMALITFARASWAVDYLYRTQGLNVQFPGPSNLGELRFGMVAWLCAWVTSWKFAIDLTLIEYSKLPTSPPQGCFVSAAAANGHPALVGITRNSDGQLVSMQMARCKFIELVLAASSPTCHKVIRRIYNWIGPQLAKQLRCSVWTADIAYIVLKPVELVSLAIQKFLGYSNNEVRLLYKIREGEASSQK